MPPFFCTWLPKACKLIINCDEMESNEKEVVGTQNKDYWKKRMAALEDEQHRHSMDYYKDVQNQFRRASNSIQMDIERWYQRLADNNDISYAAAKRLLKKNELEEFHWSVEQYIKAGKENAVDQRWMKELENASARHHISYLEAMKIQAQQHAELLSAEFEGGMTDFLHKSYADSYYHTAYEISKGAGIGVNIVRLDERGIDTLIKKPWARDGARFSDRIWTNKEKLVNSLHTELTQSIIRGDPPQKAIEGLAKTMNVSKAQAGRLIMTESAAVSSAAARDSYKELGVEKYEILATLDSRTSEICRDLDGKVFDMKDYAVGDTAPPFHPHCRTTTVPFFDDEFSAVEKRAARDDETGNTVYVDGTLNYREWEKENTGEGVAGHEQEADNPEYLIRSHKGAGITTNERLMVNEAVASVPCKVQDQIHQGTIIDVGQIGSSQYDYENDILYVAKGAEMEDIIHEIGHLVENKMMDSEKIRKIKKQILKNVSPLDFVNETYYNANGDPIEIFLIKSDKFVSDYQGRVYINDWSELLDENMEIKQELLAEFISEPFREYVQNPERLKTGFPDLYEMIKEAVE